MAEFFQVIGGFDRISLLDLLLRRYSNIDYIMNLPFSEFCEFVVVASRKMQEEDIKQQWIQLLPFMAIKWLKYIPFEEYRQNVTGENIDTRPKQEIIDEIMKMHGMESLDYGNI